MAPTDGSRPGTPLVMSFSLALIGAGRETQRRLEAELDPHGVTLRHIGALGHLARQPELSYSDLARRSGITAQSMHATVRQLETLGAVTRDYAGHGHRASLEVTAVGHRLLVLAGQIAERLDVEMIGTLPQTTQDQMRRVALDIAMRNGVPGT